MDFASGAGKFSKRRTENEQNYEKEIEKTYEGRILLRKWFPGERTKLNRVGNKDLLDQARLFSFGNQKGEPMRNKREGKLLHVPNNEDIKKMKAAVQEILSSEANDGNRLRNSREFKHLRDQ